MSYLRLFAPSEGEIAVDELPVDHTPVLIPFRGGPQQGLQTNRIQDALTRAQIIHKNRRCPDCRQPLVEPIELHDAILNRTQMPIPGTATLVGFRCNCCGTEWPVDE